MGVQVPLGAHFGVASTATIFYNQDMLPNLNLIWKQLTFGFIVWLVPFFSAFLFYSPSGELAIDLIFFKSIMVVVGALIGALMAVMYFKNIGTDFVKTGVMLGLVWLVLNWVLDLALIAVGFFDYTLPIYFQQIGLRYLSMPILTTAMGWALRQHQGSREIE